MKFADKTAEGREPETGSFEKVDRRMWFIRSFEADSAQTVDPRRGAKAPRVGLDYFTSFFITRQQIEECQARRNMTGYAKSHPVAERK